MDAERRRSSIKDPQIQHELRSINPQDVLRGIPEFKLQNITSRLSGNSQRGSLQTKKSGIPTPSNATFSGRGKLSAGRQPQSGAMRARTLSTSSSRSGAPQFKGALPPPLRLGFQAPNVSSLSLNSTRRKSKSYESLLQTPAFTPGRSRSKSPGMSTIRRRGYGNEGGMDQAKNIQLTKDRTIQKEMAQYIYHFLETQSSPVVVSQWKDLMIPPTITVAKYYTIVKFVASNFVGDSFFGKKPEEYPDKIIEVSKILKYPAQLSKSHLKTPTVQHAWPMSLTFLAWLCGRAQSLIIPPPERSGAFDLASNGFAETFLPSSLTMFSHYLVAGVLELDTPEIDAELENFRTRVRSAQTAEIDKTMEELTNEREVVRAELQRLNEEQDPIKVLQERYDSEVKQLAALQDKIREAENKCKQYENINHLVIEQERLNLEIKAQLNDLKELRERIENQTLNHEDAARIASETAERKKQLESLVGLNHQLKTEIEKRGQMLKNSEKRFYDVCKRFSVVEKYNELILFFHLNDLTIPANPFSPEELKEWLEKASQTLRLAENTVNEMKKKVGQTLEQQNKENIEITGQLEKLGMKVDDYYLKLEALTKEIEDFSQEAESEYKQDLHKLHQAKLQLQQDEKVLKKALKKREVWEDALKQWEQRLDAFRVSEKQWDDKVEEEFNKCLLFEAELLKTCQGCLETACEKQEAFYQDLLGVNIYEDLPSDENEEEKMEDEDGENKKPEPEDKKLEEEKME